MQDSEFRHRFNENHEIGRDVTDAYLLVFYDNGSEIGLWRQHRATTQGTGRVLSLDEAVMARYWYGQGGQDRPACDRGLWLTRVTSGGRSPRSNR